MSGPKAVEGWTCEEKERKEEERKREWFGQFECEGVLGHETKVLSCRLEQMVKIL